MRADLAALTPGAIATLANLGLVKRAQREIEGGAVPALEEGVDGTVTGALPDGARVVWPAGKSMRETTCSCGAARACRHRVALALAYGPWSRARGGSVEAAAAASPFEGWSPAEIEDAALLAHLGARAFEAAKRMRGRGYVAKVRAASAADPVPTVALPSSTVRFLAPRAVAFAKCDCERREACAHVALAVWAARVAPPGGALEQDSWRTVEIAPTSRAVVEAATLAPLRELAAWVATVGVVQAAETDVFGQRAALARRPLEERGYVWMVGLLDDLERLVAAYRTRSALYRPDRALELIAEIEARSRSALAPTHVLPSSFVVGAGLPFETKLEQLRLTSLGARVTVEGDATLTRVLLASHDTGDVLVMESSHPTAQVPTSAEAARRRVGGATLEALAGGEVVTRSAVRRANDALVLRGGRGMTTDVVPQSGDFAFLRAPRRVDRVADLRKVLAARPPRMLRPRRLGEDAFVLAVASVDRVGYDVAEQAVFATLADADRDAVVLVRRHTRAAPAALDALGAALTSRWGPVRWVAGEVHVAGGALVIEPTLVVCDRVVVPDFEAPTGAVELPRARVPLGVRTVLDAVLEVSERLVEAVHLGFDALPPAFVARLDAAAAAARSAGLAGLSTRAIALSRALRAAPDPNDPAAHAMAVHARWADAAVRTALVTHVA